MSRKTVVIGGGITGLSAAYYLQKAGVDTELVEKTERLGGKVRTFHKDGFTIERGPDSFLARKTSMLELAEEIGMGQEVVKNSTGNAYILAKGRLNRMPQGSHMGIPTRKRPLLKSTLFSGRGKVRALLEPGKRVKETTGDEALGLFLRRRLGNEVVENAVEPLLSGIYAGDIDRLSMDATFPQFREITEEYGSLVKGLKDTGTAPPVRKKKNKEKPSAFRSFAGGLSGFIDALQDALKPGSVQLSKGVDHIEKKEHGYHILMSDGEVKQADDIILAVPAPAAAKMLAHYDWTEPLKQMKATSVANVAMAFDKSAIKQDIDGTGFVVSRTTDDYRITACTWTHKKWAHAAPEGKALLRCYIGKPGDEEVVDKTDEEIRDIVMKDLKKIMDITDQPDFFVVTRWHNAMPQYSVGHKERLNQVTNHMKRDLPGVQLAGAHYYGIGLPDCIDQGKEAAGRIIESE
ncbi:protoporphyrinogen oxidase [Salimicrobium salexigens]|uniref:Coproporphyrinogen III oxidase n=1 Tax=Salimicrobium salexigens TaxID=908941 RepID=A0ABY1KK95_9BACI|nr:protoporphyrinogen oxidase [Salimicrobium salexigens]SIS44769.1 oxygen-dependent protoporphyrinogen oxidase [Salimicrobium salexigens]